MCCPRSSDVLSQAAQLGVVGSPCLEVLMNLGDVALRDVLSGHGGVGERRLGLALVILLFFSNLE